jgi:hypothetical protein
MLAKVALIWASAILHVIVLVTYMMSDVRFSKRKSIIKITLINNEAIKFIDRMTYLFNNFLYHFIVE